MRPLCFPCLYLTVCCKCCKTLQHLLYFLQHRFLSAYTCNHIAHLPYAMLPPPLARSSASSSSGVGKSAAVSVISSEAEIMPSEVGAICKREQAGDHRRDQAWTRAGPARKTTPGDAAGFATSTLEEACTARYEWAQEPPRIDGHR